MSSSSTQHELLDEARAELARARNERDEASAAVRRVLGEIAALAPGQEEEKKRKDLESWEKAVARATADVEREERRVDVLSGVAPLVTRKRLHPAERGIGLFVAETFKQQRDTHTLQRAFELGDATPDDERRVMELAERLNGLAGNPDHVVVRKCYGELATLIEGHIDGGRDVLLAGSRGTGKSVLGTMMAVKFALRGRVVVYSHKSERMLLLAENIADEVRKELRKSLKEYDYDEELAPGVWMCGAQDADLFKSIGQSELTLAVHDVGEDPANFVDTAGSNVRLVVSSPNANKLRFLKQMVNFEKLFMPMWTLEELLMARRRCFPLVKEEWVRSRFDTMSGVARWVLHPKEGESERVQRAQIRNTRIGVMESVFLASSFEHLEPKREASGESSTPEQGSDLLFQVIPSDDYTDYTTAFSSDFVASELAIAFARASEEAVWSFAQAVRNNPHMGAFRGYLFEGRAHQILVSTQARNSQMQLRHLVKGGGGPEKPVPFAIGLLIENPFVRLEDVTEIKPYQYFRPGARNFKSVDSFAVLPQSLFDAALKRTGANASPENAYALVAFQITVSQNHDVNGSGLKRVKDHVQRVLKLPEPAPAPAPVPAPKSRRAKAPPPAPAKPKLLTYLVFVLDSNVLTTVQKIKKDDGDDFVDVTTVANAQFSLTLGSGFARLAGLVKQ